MIFYFTGTGNSLYVAKKLAEHLGETQISSMTCKCEDMQIGGMNERLGFVFPSYYGNLPRIVRRFIEDLDIHPDTYIFGIVTMGAVFWRGSISALEKLLSEKGLKLQYGSGVYMPANYIANVNPMFIGRAAKADRRIKRISGDISRKKFKVQRSSIIADNLYEDIESLDKAFFAESTCKGCGQCAKVCPVRNIELTQKKPRWLHHCEHCMACIHWCPEAAIQYGLKTKKRRRYHNPNICIDEIIQHAGDFADFS